MSFTSEMDDQGGDSFGHRHQVRGRDDDDDTADADASDDSAKASPTSSSAWQVPVGPMGGGPQWVILDVGPDMFVSGVSLQLSGRDGANPRHCRLVMSSSQTTPERGWYVRARVRV